jgi:hypothetical protein
MKTLIIAIVLIAGVALGQAPTASLIQLIANPEKWHNREFSG